MGEDNSTPADTGPDSTGESKDVFELEFADSREDVKAPGAPAGPPGPPPAEEDEPVEDLFADDLAELGKMASDVIDATGQSYAGATPEDAARAESGRAVTMPAVARSEPADEVFARTNTG